MSHLQKGFSLIEMLIVIAVIAILAAIVIPQYNAYLARNNARQAAKLLATDIARAEEEAKRTGVVSGPCTFPPTAPIDKNALYAGALAFVLPGGHVVFSDALPPNIALASIPGLAPLGGCTGTGALQFPDETGIVFNTQGIPVLCGCDPQATATETLTVSDPPRADQFVVRVDTRTGVVTGP